MNLPPTEMKKAAAEQMWEHSGGGQSVDMFIMPVRHPGGSVE